MKHTTLIILFLFTGLTYPDAYARPNREAGDRPAPDTSQRRLAVPEASLLRAVFYDKYNRPEQLSDTLNYLVVLKSKKYCDDCFSDINYFIRAVRKELNARFIAIALIDSSTLDRKRAHLRNSHLMPDLDGHYFQYLHSSQPTFFNLLETVYSPALLIVHKGRVTHVPYPEVFQFPMTDINYRVQQDIFRLLK